MNAALHDGHRCELGEGPLWHPERRELFWFDILSNQLRTAERQWKFEEHVSAAGWLSRDSLLIASETALFRFDLESGARDDVVALEADNAVTRSNDGRADRQGGFWIGTMGKRAEPQAGAIYRYHKGELRKLFPDITISNAICFSPDGRTAYFTDTVTQVINSVSLDDDGWPDAEPRVHIDLSDTPWRPDGAVTDADGNLWNAQWGGHRVACYGPDGDFLRAVKFPPAQTSCPAFGGADLATLFVTSAAEGLPHDDLQGRTFCAASGTRGLPEPQVIL